MNKKQARAYIGKELVFSTRYSTVLGRFISIKDEEYRTWGAEIEVLGFVEEKNMTGVPVIIDGNPRPIKIGDQITVTGMYARELTDGDKIFKTSHEANKHVLDYVESEIQKYKKYDVLFWKFIAAKKILENRINIKD